jgi:rhodanese-related sulfurtransferase
MNFRVFFVTSLLCLIATPRDAIIAQTNLGEMSRPFQVEVSSRGGFDKSNPICGVLAFKVAGQAVGREIALEDLLDQKYLDDPVQGSSTSNLEALASDNQLHTAVYRQLGIGALSSFSTPAILHLKTRSDGECGGHWATFLGLEGKDAILYDSQRSPNLIRIEPNDLLTRWDGVAIQLSNEPISFLAKLYVSFLGVLGRILSILVCFAMVGVISSCFKTESHAKTLIALVFASLLSLVCLQFSNSSSIFQNSFSSNWMAQNSADVHQFGEATYDEILDISSNKGGQLIDARTSSARKQFVIAGSKHVGVNFDIVDFRQAISGMETSTPLVVYCNSPNCKWAAIVAHKLRYAGFENIKIFARGVTGFIEDSVSNSKIAGAQ